MALEVIFLVTLTAVERLDSLIWLMATIIEQHRNQVLFVTAEIPVDDTIPEINFLILSFHIQPNFQTLS